MEPYKIISDSNQVMVWSSRRLPFEPRGWLVLLRKEIRDAVGKLDCRNSLVLDGIFSSLDADTFDVENVLFYNVGVGYFKDSARNGIRFQRVRSSPPTHPSLANNLTHYQRYRLTRRDENFSEWLKGRTLASWDRIPMKQGTLPGVESIWDSMRSSSEKINTTGRIADREFGLTVIIHPPSSDTRLNLASRIKGVFDGVLAGFHQHDGSAQEIGKILARKINKQPDQILSQLSDGSYNLLGKRRLVWLRGNGVQWNPADDRCVAGELFLGSNSSDQSNYELSGEFFRVMKA